MQFLRRVTVNIRKNYLVSMRTYGTRSTARGGTRKTKEERFELVVEFIAKYQASHNGEFPGMNILRKEVGGKYETLKEILHDLENMKQAGKLEGSSSVIFSGSEKQPEPEIALRKGLKDCTNMTEAECVTDRTTTKAVERRAQSRGFGLDPSQSGKVDNECGVTASKDHVKLSQQTTLSEVALGDIDLQAEFPLFIRSVSELTTSKDLREAFQDCGEIWNATTIRCFSAKVARVDAIVNFKTEGGLKAARMKETVLVRGDAVDVNGKSTACQVKQVKAPAKIPRLSKPKQHL